MKTNQEDCNIATKSKVEHLTDFNLKNKSPNAARRAFAEKLPLAHFFDGSDEKSFSTLGRIATISHESVPWRFDPEKRKLVEKRAKLEGKGHPWVPYQEAGLTPQDILAFAAQGAKLTSSDLDEAIRIWWKQRQASPLWQKSEVLGKQCFLSRLLDRRSKKLAKKIIADLGYDEEQGQVLFKTGQFSRRTVYTRDYAAIPKELRRLFRMVPLLIFSPRNSTQLRQFIKYAAERNIKITPRGRGTWAMGGALLTKGGVVLEMASFEKKIEVDGKNQSITVSGSVDFQEAEEALNAHNLTLRVRPSNKYGVIGGFLSVGEPLKGGLGLNAFSFGHIRNSVLSIRVVTSQGEERLVRKDQVDFPYFLGTNGRYGIITEITLQALPKPVKHYSFALNFFNAKSAFRFLHKFQDDLETGKVQCQPIHVEFFGKAYLDEIKKIKSLEKKPITVNLISPESIKRITPSKDTVLFVFYDKDERRAFSNYVKRRNGFGIAAQREADKLWEERFSPMKLRKKGDLLTAEVILPIEKVGDYLSEITEFAAKLRIKILPVAHILNTKEALVLPQFLTDRRHAFQYYRHFSLVPVLARQATKRYHGRPYGYGLWFAGLSRRALGQDVFQDLKRTKKRLDPKGILNPGKLNEIRSRFWNQTGKMLLHERAIDLLALTLRFQTKVSKSSKFQEMFLSTNLKPYHRDRGDALHRCIKCSACMICPLAQIWEKSRDPKLMKDAIYITPRFKMEYMQRHLYEGKKLTQEDVDRFVLCFRCGVAERKQVCPISDMLLEVEKSETTPGQKKLPTYDEFEERLQKAGYDVDGAIQRYLEILKTHPGVARAMQEVLGSYRVPKTGDLVVLQPKTDFAMYKVKVDQDRCINCGKCGDEHTTSQRGFWDPRNPRNMVSLNDLLRELHGRVPKSWFRDQGGPIPTALKMQGRSNGEYICFPKPSRLDAGHYYCNGCLYCVIECPVDAIRVKLNDYYVNLAGKDFSREDVRRINEESRTGDVPTSGTGSTGLFGGKGFDRYMFDFSVIVRPTRDGIREAIDIGVNLGRKPLFHLFENSNGKAYPRIKTHFSTLDLPTPILLELPVVEGRESVRDLAHIFARCAHRENTLLFLNLFQFMENFEDLRKFSSNIGLRLLPQEIDTLESWINTGEADESFKNALCQIPFVELVHEPLPNSESDFLETKKRIRELFSGPLVVSHLLVCPLDSDIQRVAEQVAKLAEWGAEIIHLKTHFNPEKGYYESADLLPACYDQLLAKSLHTQVTLICNGVKSPADLGIAMMLGASAVVVDRAALVALNHEFPMREEKGLTLHEIEIAAGVRRLQNLYKSWHKQIREVLGAFGVRDIRRTVGERGRLIDLKERENKMRSIVADKKLLNAAKKVNQEKISEDAELAGSASWKYSELSQLIKPVPPPNAKLLGERRESLESMLAARGDRRWNADMLTATWLMASGSVPSHEVPQTGCDIGGGSFDAMKFANVQLKAGTLSLEAAIEEVEKRIQSQDQELIHALDVISISAGLINQHRRPDSPALVNSFPIDAADMSLGSIGWKLTLARYLAGLALKRYTGTGEGGYPLEKYERLARFFPGLSNEEVSWLGRQMERWVATQTATGYFGVTEDTLRRANKIVLKFAQGAKPGLGGHILGAKVTTQVEDLRGVIAGISVFSPFPFHDVYSIEDVTKMIEWLRTINPDAIITVKISTSVDVYHVALGLVTGGADEIQIDATAGGTGAAPDIARNRIAMPLEYALADVHKFLVEQGERNKVVLVASGGIRSAYDMAKAIILGADKVILGTQEIVAEQCNRCGNCEAPGGCQKGITTTVEQLEEQKEIVLNAQWLINSQVAIVQHLIKMMYIWGIKDIRELRGRTDLIADWGWQEIQPTVSSIKHRLEETKKKTKIFINEWDNSKEERKELDACGVVSFACTQAVPVESIQTACQQMHNRGNGRGGGILGLGGMFSQQFEDCYALQIIALVPEKKRKQKILEIAKHHLKDFEIHDRRGDVLDAQKLTALNIEGFRNPRRQQQGRDVTYQEAGLTVDPGDLYRFFVRVKKQTLLNFAKQVLEDCRISDVEKRILENGNPTQFLQRHNIAGKWIEYFVKYYDLLTDDYLNRIDPDSEFWQEPKYESLWRDLEDEFVYRRAFEINQHYYIDPQNRSENPEAFVSSMMKDGGIWKLVGYAEQAAGYWIVGDAQYVPMAKLDKTIAEVFQEEHHNAKSKIQITWREEEGQHEINMSSQKRKISLIVPKGGKRAVVIYKYGAHVWIGHQRFPTVFSPYSGGSHPFYGRVYEALIHNGDFANYVAMVRFWDQFGGAPQFRTDTEMAAKAYAILKQMGYPQTHLFEAIAPTTGIDLKRLKRTHPELAADFEAIQKSQIAGSPDGPWFFIIGDQDPVTRDLKVVGLTDTSVLRPSVFVWQESSNGKWASIGLVGSEEQACRSVLDSLYKAGVLATKEPDCVKIIRGGSVEQEKTGEIQGGGAIVYHLKRKQHGKYDLEVTDKYGTRLNSETGQEYDLKSQLRFDTSEVQSVARQVFDSKGNMNFGQAEKILQFVKDNLKNWEYNTFRLLVGALGKYAQTDELRSLVIEALSLVKDGMQSMDVGQGQPAKKRSTLIQIVSDELDSIFDHIEKLGTRTTGRKYYRLTHSEKQHLSQCEDKENILVVDATGFPPEGHQSLARTLVRAYDKGWRKFIVYNTTGQRYLGAGFGPNTHDLEIHLYGSPGQDIANSMMGGTVYVHADAQNDMAKIIHSGTVVVHGLAGNTGIYGAKGGDIFVRDSVGTRWVINSVSSPAGPGLRVVIVGTAMEYLAESLMGGVVLVLGLEWDSKGVLRRKYLPFAGNSILAGASAGKVIVYDPDDRLEKEQYAGAVDMGFLSRDWAAVYKNLTNLVGQAFSQQEWVQAMERWHTLAKYSLKSEAWSQEKKQSALDELIEVLKRILEPANEAIKWANDVPIFKSLIEERLTGKEWRTLVRQLGQILSRTPWKEGIELLERLRDWKEVTELLVKADKFFHLGLIVEDDWLYLPIDGRKTEIKWEDFKVLRPLKPEEKKRLEEMNMEKLEKVEAQEVKEY